MSTFLLQAIGIVWLATTMGLGLFVLIDITAERLRKRRRRLDFRAWQRELDMDRHPAFKVVSR